LVIHYYIKLWNKEPLPVTRTDLINEDDTSENNESHLEEEELGDSKGEESISEDGNSHSCSTSGK